jgi:hypothetical protein
MLSGAAFWSYTHRDNDDDGNRIRELADLLIKEVALITGEDLDLFVDDTKIDWGHDVLEQIEEYLQKVTFFIPILTPRYFKSGSCRKELMTFAQTAESLGANELILPIIYQDVRGLHDDEPSDPAIRLVKRFKWESWTGLRLTEPGSPEFRTAVNRMAKRLADVLEDVEESDLTSPTRVDARREFQSVAEVNEDKHEERTDPEKGGVVDDLAASEAAMHELVTTMTALATTTNEVGEIMQEGTVEIDESDGAGRGFRGRLAVLIRVSKRLEVPSQSFDRLTAEYVTMLSAVDRGVQIILRLLIDSPDESDAEQGAEFVGALEALITTWRSVEPSIVKFESQLATLEPLGRAIRPPVRLMRASILRMKDASVVFDGWEELISRWRAR